MRSSDEIMTLVTDLRKQKKMTSAELAERVGIAKSAMSRYENRTRQFPVNKVNEFAKALSTSPEYLLGFEEEPTNDLTLITNISAKLKKSGQKKVLTYAQNQLQEQEQDKVVRPGFAVKEKVPTIHISGVAANPTQLPYGDTVVEEEEFERVPDNADFAVPILGDSMMPLIRNGQFVFVKEQPDVEDGEIAIVEIDGEGVTCKKICKDYHSQMIILHSINEKYPDREIAPDRIRIIGKVVF